MTCFLIWRTSALGSPLCRTLSLEQRKKGLYRLEIKEELPERHLVLAYTEQQSTSAAANKFLEYLIMPDL